VSSANVEGVSRDDQRPPQQGGLSVRTLLISSLAAATAAVVVPTFWERGSVLATAVTPVVVAIVAELLNRQANAIKTVAPKVARRTGTGAAVRGVQPPGVGARGEGPERAGRWGGTDTDPFGLRTEELPRRRAFPWKLAIGTGLLAAVIGAAVVTVSELAVFGHSVSRPNRSTSVFGGSHSSADATPTPTATTDENASPTAAPSDTTSPEATGTPPPESTATVTGTAEPNPLQATPEPSQTPPGEATAPPTEATPAPTP
jgi:hypothetical protein